MATDDHYAFFHAATAAVCSHLLPEEGLQACAHLLSEHMPVGRMYLEVYEHEIGAIRSIATATVSQGKAMDMLVTMDETSVLCTVVAEKSMRPGQDFFPLGVHYIEKTLV